MIPSAGENYITAKVQELQILLIDLASRMTAVTKIYDASMQLTEAFKTSASLSLYKTMHHTVVTKFF